MDCEEVRARLVSAPGDADVRAHIAACAACAHEERAERLLSEALESRLPQHPASPALKRRLAAAWPADAPAASPRRSVRPLVPALLAAAAVVLLALPLALAPSRAWRGHGAGDAMVTEAVNDHLRVLVSEHPVEIASGGVHQVKPWFEGRLDFAPVVAFGGDADYPLQGGAVAWFVDRKAAAFVFKRRLHVISLFVFRADGLPWAAHGAERIGGVEATPATARGFNVLLWRAGDLGYALVSDVDAAELRDLAGRIVGPPAS
jgi:anti-sigma factor RsiW